MTKKFTNATLVFMPINHLNNHSQGKQFFKNTWTPHYLHKELYPIAMLESGWNKNLDHEPSKKGDFYTAFGPLGLKPVTGWEQFKRTAYLKKQYPQIGTAEDFEKQIYNDTVFYNKVASAHWRTLRLRYQSIYQAAYAWRWGPGKADVTEETEVSLDEYIVRFKEKTALSHKDGDKSVNFISLESAQAAKDIQQALTRKSYSIDINSDGDRYYVYGQNQWLLKRSSSQSKPFAGYQQFSADSGRREYAFYSAAKVFGLDHLIPETHLITIGSKEWVASKMLSGDYSDFKKNAFSQELIKTSFSEKAQSGDLARWATMDFVLGNPDRHAGNMLMNQAGDIRLIDHDSTMCGKDFSPNNDKYSFVAYYLRFTYGNGYYYFSKMPALDKMPLASDGADAELARWAMALDHEELGIRAKQSGFSSEAFLNRLKLVQDFENSRSYGAHLNKLWFFV